MRRLLSALVASLAVVFALAGPVAAAPSENANCTADYVSSFEDGREFGQTTRNDAQFFGGIGHVVGGQEGLAPTDCGTR